MTPPQPEGEKLLDFVNKVSPIVKFALDAIALGGAVGIILGGILVFLYCFGEGIVPTGVSAADVFLLTYVLFVFGLIFVLGVVYGSASAMWLINLLSVFSATLHRLAIKMKSKIQKFPWLANWLIKRISKWPKLENWLRNPQKPILVSSFNSFWSNVYSIAMFAGVLGFGIAATMHSDSMNWKDYWALIKYFIFIGLFVCAAFGLRRVKDNSTVSMRHGLGVIGLIAFLAGPVLFQPKLLNMMMQQMGVRSRDTDLVWLDKESYTEVLSVAKLYQIP